MPARLADSLLLKILKQLNFNERLNIRLVSKRFRDLCDNIEIEKLIVFERTKPIAGRLKHTNEKYALVDTVSVNDLALFFGNKKIAQQLMHLRTLVIFGYRPKPIELNQKFDKLIYLQLSNVLLNSVEILKSPQIQVYINDCAYFSGANQAEDLLAVYQIDQMKSRKIKYWSMKGPLTEEFFKQCLKIQLFDSLEELQVTLTDLNSLVLLADKCRKLKKIDTMTLTQFVPIGYPVPTNLQLIACKLEELRKDLTVHLFGMSFSYF